ncbi:MAG: hypothetical protein RR626_02500 [Anaerovoracaceae bacterium]
MKKKRLAALLSLFLSGAMIASYKALTYTKSSGIPSGHEASDSDAPATEPAEEKES